MNICTRINSAARDMGSHVRAVRLPESGAVALTVRAEDREGAAQEISAACWAAGVVVPADADAVQDNRDGTFTAFIG